MNDQAVVEMVPFSYGSISEKALQALQEIGIQVQQDANGNTFECPRQECRWESDDNGGSYDIFIRGRKFWINCNPEGPQGLIGGTRNLNANFALIEEF